MTTASCMKNKYENTKIADTAENVYKQPLLKNTALACQMKCKKKQSLKGYQKQQNHSDTMQS